MKVVVGVKYSGKTTDLIRKSHEDGGYIVCFSKVEAERVHREAALLDMPIPMPISFQEFTLGRYYGPGVKKLYIDNLDMCLQTITQVEIDTVTFREDDNV